MRRLLAWVNDRTGLGPMLHEALYENIPGGAKFRYVTGSMLVFAFVTLAITGAFLALAYSPSSQSAWESVHYIQFRMQGGWLLRGVHHYMAQAMVVLLPLHLLQVVWDGAYRGPREFNHWTGLIAMLLVLALGLTGYLLPWDQKGYWSTSVATNLMTLAPGGEAIQKLAIGGADYGHHTLTRFFALHAGILPALLVLTLAAHVALFRRHGITAHPKPGRPDEYFWPRQVLFDAIACLVLLVVVLLCAIHWDLGGLLRGDLPVAHRGADLGAPADPSQAFSAARPEWYFLFLFQLLKYFPGESEFIGAIVLPGVVMLGLFAMPLIGRWQVGHYLNVVALLGLLIAAATLTYKALEDDNYSRWRTRPATAAAFDELPEAVRERFKASDDYLAAVAESHREADRVAQLVDEFGIPKTGALTLVYEDPLLQGQRIFARSCASCHSHADDEGHGIVAEESSAPNLYGVGSRAWIAGLLDPERIATAHYFGDTKHAEGQMVEFVQSELADLDDEKRAELAKLVAALSAEAELPHQREADAAAEMAGDLELGRTALVETFECTNCHVFRGEGFEGSAPDLTGYMSAAWLRQMIANPEHERMYGYEEGANDRMPAFQDADDPSRSLLTDAELDLLVRWLRRDYLPPRQGAADAHNP